MTHQPTPPDVGHRHPAVQVRPSSIHGLGVFATALIPAGTVIEVAPCLPLEQGWEKLPTILNHYLFAWPFDGTGRAVGFGWASMFNHSPTPNVGWQTHTDRKCLEFFSLQEIEADQELLIDYGEEYWDLVAGQADVADPTQISIESQAAHQLISPAPAEGSGPAKT